MSSILSLFQLNERQQQAALGRDAAIAVTAGAGSGKTRTLTGRYLALIEQGLPLRSLVAITFTEKAAREMRNRIRAAIEQWRASGLADGERERRSKGVRLRTAKSSEKSCLAGRLRCFDWWCSPVCALAEQFTVQDIKILRRLWPCRCPAGSIPLQCSKSL